MTNSNNGKGMTEMIVSVLLAAVILFLLVSRVDKFLKIKALDDCARITKYEVTEQGGAKVTMPIEDAYKNCVKEKGY